MAIVELDGILDRLRERSLDEGGPAHRPARAAEVEQAETRLGFPLPPSLRRLLLEVANGGIGPVPLLGVGAGRRSPEGDDLVGVYEGLRGPRPSHPERPGGRRLAATVDAWPVAVLPLAEARDGVVFCIDAMGGEVLSAEGQGCELGIEHGRWLQREASSLEEWLARWLHGENPPHRPQGPWGGR